MKTQTPYSHNTKTVVLLERERSQTSEIKIHRSGSQIVPTSGTYTFLSPSGEKIVDAAAVTIDDDGTCTYTLSASQLSTDRALAEGYLEEWSIIIAGATPIFRRSAAVVRRRLYPVLSQADLYDYYSQLSSMLPANLTSYQSYIDTCWNTLMRRLRTSTGSGFSYLIMSPESFFESHLHLTLSRIFEDFNSNLGGSVSHWFEMSQSHYTKYQNEWDMLSFLYDEDNDGKITDPNKRTSGSPVIYLSNPPAIRRWW